MLEGLILNNKYEAHLDVAEMCRENGAAKVLS